MPADTLPRHFTKMGTGRRINFFSVLRVITVPNFFMCGSGLGGLAMKHKWVGVQALFLGVPWKLGGEIRGIKVVRTLLSNTEWT